MLQKYSTLQSWQWWQTHWRKNDVLVSWNRRNQVPQISWVKTMEMYYLRILEDKILKSRCTVTVLPLKDLGRKRIHAFLLASDSGLAVFSIAWLTVGIVPHAFLHGSLLISTPGILDQGLALLQYDLIVTSLFTPAITLFPSKVTFWGSRIRTSYFWQGPGRGWWGETQISLGEIFIRAPCYTEKNRIIKILREKSKWFKGSIESPGIAPK